MGSDPHDVVAALRGLTAREAFKLLQSWEPTIDWAGLSGSYITLAGGGWLRFDKRLARRPSRTPTAG